jgi:hypothetical protein
MRTAPVTVVVLGLLFLASVSAIHPHNHAHNDGIVPDRLGGFRFVEDDAGVVANANATASGSESESESESESAGAATGGAAVVAIECETATGGTSSKTANLAGENADLKGYSVCEKFCAEDESSSSAYARGCKVGNETFAPGGKKVQGIPQLKLICKKTGGDEEMYLEDEDPSKGYKLCEFYCSASAEGTFGGACSVGDTVFGPGGRDPADEEDESVKPVDIDVNATAGQDGSDMKLHPENAPGTSSSGGGLPGDEKAVKGYWEEQAMRTSAGQTILARKGHTSTLVGGSLFIYGGCMKPTQTCFKELLQMELSTMAWIRPHVAGEMPPPLQGHTATLVHMKPANSKPNENGTETATVPHIYMVGGFSYDKDGLSSFHSEVYILSMATDKAQRPVLEWKKAETKGVVQLTPRQGHSAAQAGPYIYVFGGYSDDGPVEAKLLRLRIVADPFDGKYVWSELKAGGVSPASRSGHAMLLMASRYLVIFGGYGRKGESVGSLNDLHVLDVGISGGRSTGQVLAWEQPEVAGVAPLPRQAMGAAVLAARHMKASRMARKAVFFGGCSYPAKTCFNDAFVLNVKHNAWSWQGTELEGTLPERREGATLSLIPSAIEDATGAGSTNKSSTASFLEVEADSSDAKDLVLFGGGLLDTQSFNDVFVLALGRNMPAKAPEPAKKPEHHKDNAPPKMSVVSEMKLGGYDVESFDEAAELAFRKTIAALLGVDVSKVIINDVTNSEAPKEAEKKDESAADTNATDANATDANATDATAFVELGSGAGSVAVDYAVQTSDASKAQDMASAITKVSEGGADKFVDDLKANGADKITGVEVSKMPEVESGLIKPCKRGKNGEICSGNGRCLNGTCVCAPAFIGSACGTMIAPPAPVETCSRNCSNHGACVNGTCMCMPGWMGPLCGVARCPDDCNGNGACHNGTCACTPQFDGVACEIALCTNNCTGHGTCTQATAECFCFDGWEGLDCANKSSAPKPPHCAGNCSGHGVCQHLAEHGVDTALCKCDLGWMGVDCDEEEEKTVNVKVPKTPSTPNGEITVPAGDTDVELVKSTVIKESKEQVVQSFNETVKSANGSVVMRMKEGDAPEPEIETVTKTVTKVVETPVTEIIAVPASKNANLTVAVNGTEEPAIVVDGQILTMQLDKDSEIKVEKMPEDVKEGAQSIPLASPEDAKNYEKGSYFVIGYGTDAQETAKVFGVHIALSATTPAKGDIKCTDDCNGHGSCNVGECICELGWSGITCATQDCSKLNDCSGHGNCTDGACTCNERWGGEKCDMFTCDDKAAADAQCTGHGACLNGVCVCGVGFTGPDCGKEVSFLFLEEAEGTSSTAASTDAEALKAALQALVDADQSGIVLEKPLKKAHSAGTNMTVLRPAPAPMAMPSNRECPANCNGKGTCEDGKCLCHGTWGGDACQYAPNCTHECAFEGGVCDWVSHKQVHKHCRCYTGWTGHSCSEQSCPNNCTNPDVGMCVKKHKHGKAMHCQCKPGFSGKDCSQSGGCGGLGHDCGANGQCEDGACMCFSGWGGPLCDVVVCPSNCTSFEHGTCSLVVDGKGSRRNRACVCHLGWKGEDCSEPDPCPKSCSGNGKCSSDDPDAIGRHCLCNKGWAGDYCEKKAVCPGVGKAQCGGAKRGKCVDGVCECNQGFSGEGCMVSQPCDKNCSDNGECVGGSCECFPGWMGPACDKSAHCPNDCSKHGKVCLLGQCECKAGWQGDDCSVPKVCPKASPENSTRAPQECNGEEHGKCVLGECICKMGWGGDDCTKDMSFECPKKCSKQGECHNGKCFCHPGFLGEDCSVEKLCPIEKRSGKECAGQGVCQYGTCFCAPGRMAPDCRAPKLCPRDADGQTCSGAGVCLNGTCFCAPGRYGEACHRGRPCPNNCSRNGFCHHGKCLCDLGFTGEDCNVPVGCKGTGKNDKFPAGCSGHGRCLRGRCYCSPGWKGEACDNAIPCPASCGLHGHCEGSVCICDPGYSGANCTDHTPCPKHCNHHGVCVLGVCACHPGWAGAACEIHMPCPNKCSGHGDCVAGNCVCDFDYSGPDCGVGGGLKRELFGPHCPRNCSGHGLCDEGKCSCDIGWRGLDCNTPRFCPANCSGHGLCWHGDCYCDPGYNGTTCHVYSGCGFSRTKEGECSGHGTCAHGQCFCYPKFTGRNCETNVIAQMQMMSFREARCPVAEHAECAGHGRCEDGQCACGIGWYGAACDQQTTEGKCPNRCSNKGICNKQTGVCECEPGWTGMDCSKITRKALALRAESCVAKCGGPGSKGKCIRGVCHCEVGWGGDACDEQTCKDSCTMAEDGSTNGECVEGKCKCKPGFAGEACEAMCPNACSQHGTCQASPGTGDTENDVHCYCQPGFTGEDCSMPAVERSGMVVSSVVAMAIATFVIGLCCIPLARDYYEKRELRKYISIIKGEGSMQGQLQRLASIPVNRTQMQMNQNANINSGESVI